MTAFSNYLEAQIIEDYLRTTPVYLALFTGDPTDAGTGPEAAYTGYARQLSTWTAAVDGLTRNAAPVAFPANQDVAPVTITHAAIFDAAVGGNMLLHGPLVASRDLQQNDLVSFPVNALEMQLN